MTLKRRLTSLEGASAAPFTVFAEVPENWSSEQVEKAIRTAAKAEGIEGPFDTFPIVQRGRQGVQITGTGSIEELLAYVAENNRPLGGTQQETKK